MIKSFDISKMALFVILLFLFYRVFQYGVPFVMDFDALGSYIYLPLLFDYHTFQIDDLSIFDEIKTEYLYDESLYQFVQLENGQFISRYTSGWAVMMLPFYFIAEIWACVGGYKTDGFSFPYKFMMVFGLLTYFMLGLFILRKLLINFVSKQIAAVTLILLFFGTNLYFTAYASLSSTHLLVFTLTTMLIYQTMRFHKNVSLLNGMILGGIIGLIGLVRIPDLLFALIPIFWNTRGLKSFYYKLKLFSLNYLKIVLVTIITCLLTLTIQLAYWKFNSGSWLIDSYANQPGEGFDLLSPYFAEFLFSFRKGWLLYTPLAFFAIVGLVWLWKHKPEVGLPFLLTFILFFYVVSSWTTWWYADSFSSRAMIDYYAVIAIGLAYFIKSISYTKFKIPTYVLISVLFIFSVFQFQQAANGIIHTSRMTKEYYFSVFGQLSPVTEEQRSLLLDDPYLLQQSNFIDTNRFVQCYFKSFDLNEHFVDSLHLYTPDVYVKASEISTKLHNWVRIRWTLDDEIESVPGKIFNVCVMHNEKSYVWLGFDQNSNKLYIDSLAGYVEMLYVTPNIRSPKDKLRFGIWSFDGSSLKVKKLEIWGYERK